MEPVPASGEAARALHTALTALQRGDATAARIAAETALAGFAGATDRTGTAAAHQLLGMIAVGAGDLPAALEHVDAALPLRESTGDREGVAALWQERMEICLRLGDGAQALAAAASQVRSLEGAEDREGRAHARHQLAQLQLQSGDVDAAETTLQEALWELDGPGWARARSAVLLQLASVWMARQDPDRALGVARQSLEVARGAQHRPAEIDAIQHIGVILAAKGELHPACRALEDALVGRELLKDADGKISVLRELGPLEVALGRVEEGVEHLLRAAELLAEQGALRPGIATAQVAMSLADDAGHRDAALSAGKALVALAARTGDAEAVAAATFLLATRLAGAGHLDEAATRFGEAHAAQSALGLQHDAAVSLGMLGQVRVARGEHAAGRAALAESHASLVALGSEAADTVREILEEWTAQDAAEGS